MSQGSERNHFLEQVCREVRAKDMHGDIQQELSGHLEDLITEREAEGYSPKEAEAWAVAQMGSPQVLGKSFDRIHRPRMNGGMLGIVFCFIAVSLVGMLSVDTHPKPMFDDYSFFNGQLLHIALGLVCMIGLYFMDFRKLQRLAWLLYIVTMVGILSMFPFGTVDFYNARLVYLEFPFHFLINPWIAYVIIAAVAGILTSPPLIRMGVGRTRHVQDLLVIILPIPLLVRLDSIVGIAHRYDSCLSYPLLRLGRRFTDLSDGTMVYIQTD